MYDNCLSPTHTSYSSCWDTWLLFLLFWVMTQEIILFLSALFIFARVSALKGLVLGDRGPYRYREWLFCEEWGVWFKLSFMALAWLLDEFVLTNSSVVFSGGVCRSHMTSMHLTRVYGHLHIGETWLHSWYMYMYIVRHNLNALLVGEILM